MQFGTLMANSLLYATVGSALAVLLALVPAFGLSRMEIPGKGIHLRPVADRPDVAAANRADSAL